MLDQRQHLTDAILRLELSKPRMPHDGADLRDFESRHREYGGIDSQIPWGYQS